MLKASQKNKVSIQAFIEEIQNWQLTLLREQKKLKQFRTLLKQKILINQINILIIQIDNEIIKYKKFKDSNKIQFLDIIQQYNQHSKKFIDLMQNIGNFQDKIQAIPQSTTYLTQSLDQHPHQFPPKQKYQKQTFAYSISKKQKNTNISSIQSKIIPKKYSIPSHPQLKTNLTNKTFQNSFNIININKKQSNKSNKLTPNLSISKIKKKQQQFDSWEIKYQLKQIKSMIHQIHNQIKFHSHQDIELQLSKIQRNNKKINLDLKTLKQDNQYIITKIKKLSILFLTIEQQLILQKQIQTQMIQQFEHPQKNTFKNKNISNQNIKNITQNSVEQFLFLMQCFLMGQSSTLMTLTTIYILVFIIFFFTQFILVVFIFLDKIVNVIYIIT